MCNLSYMEHGEDCNTTMVFPRTWSAEVRSQAALLLDYLCKRKEQFSSLPFKERLRDAMNLTTARKKQANITQADVGAFLRETFKPGTMASAHYSYVGRSKGAYLAYEPA